MGTPDKHEPGLRILQTFKLTTMEMLKVPAHIRVLVADILKEIPDPDFIEIRAIKYEVKEGNDERTTGPALPGPGTD